MLTLMYKLNKFIEKLGIAGPRVSDDLKELQKKYDNLASNIDEE